MPLTYEVKNDGMFVHTRAYGEITEQDLLEYQAAVLADPRVKSGYYELLDATTGYAADVSEATLVSEC